MNGSMRKPSKNRGHGRVGRVSVGVDAGVVMFSRTMRARPVTNR